MTSGPAAVVALVAVLAWSQIHTPALARNAPSTQYRSGAYCYAYRDRLIYPDFPLSSYPRPTFGAHFRRIRITRTSLPFRNRPYTLRCFFRLVLPSTASVRFDLDTKSAGRARLLRRGKPVLQVQSAAKSWQWTGATRNALLELQYTVPSPVLTPALTLTATSTLTNKPIDFETDMSAVLPILIGATPRVSTVSGDRRIALLGYGLDVKGTVAEFGTPKRSNRVSATGMTITPKTNTAGAVQLSVKTPRGLRSNSIMFQYTAVGKGCDDEVSFSVTKLKTPDSPTTMRFVKQATSVAVGPDQRLYIGTLSGNLLALGYDMVSLRARTLCGSRSLQDKSFRKADGTLSPRTVLGVAFDPSASGPMTGPMRPYVTTSTLNWWLRETVALSNKAAWHNGAVERLVVYNDPGKFPIKQSAELPLCIRYDKRIVSGLPVGNGGSHSVNALAFDQNGDLLIGVGGATNMGLPGVRLGNTWESPLSAAVVRASVATNPNFEGRVTYLNSGSAPHLAKLSKKSKNSVDVFASGFRQLYTMTVTKEGAVYGVDQGPGCPLGGAAVQCSAVNARKPAWNLSSTTDWPSPVRGSHVGCPGLTREDKLVRISQGRYYGHPNLNRGQTECVYIDPTTGRTPFGGKPPPKYKRHIDLVPASVTGVVEYTARHFCGKMRGDLVLSTFLGGTTWRVRKTANDRKVAREVLALDEGGIALVQDVQGNLVFVRFTANEVVVLKPQVSPPKAGELDVRAVSPTRLGRPGGQTLYIGGFGLGKARGVRVGKAKCTVTARSGSGRLLVCKTPSRAQAECDVCSVTVESDISGRGGRTLTKALSFMKK